MIVVGLRGVRRGATRGDHRYRPGHADRHRQGWSLGRGARGAVGGAARIALRRLAVLVAGRCRDTRLLSGGLLRAAPPPDRKSTRLNSSHANISYAVFCLKKKIDIASILIIF